MTFNVFYTLSVARDYFKIPGTKMRTGVKTSISVMVSEVELKLSIGLSMWETHGKSIIAKFSNCKPGISSVLM